MLINQIRFLKRAHSTRALNCAVHKRFFSALVPTAPVPTALVPTALVLGALVLGVPADVILAQEEAAPTPASLIDQQAALANPVIDGSAINIGADLSLDTFEIRLDGQLFPLASTGSLPANGVVGWYFRGKGRHVLTPVTNGEWRSLSFRSQIEGFKMLETDFTEALLWLDAATSKKLLTDAQDSESQDNASQDNHAPAPRGEAVEDLLTVIHGTPLADLPLRLLAATNNQAAIAPGKGIAYLLTNSLDPGPTLVAYDLRGVLDGEETALYVFERPGSSSGGNRRDRRENNEDQDGSDRSDPGFWYSSRHIEAVRKGTPFGEGRTALLDVERVSVHSAISKDVDLEGEVTVLADVVATSVAVLPFELAPSLRLSRVDVARNGESTPATFTQATPEEGVAVAVLLDPPLQFGDRVEIKMTYAGDEVLVDDGVRTYRVGARSSWYPNFDDLSHFDLTFEVPKGNTVIAVGEPRPVQAKDGKVVSRWVTKTPIRVAGFNYGSFKKYQVKEENTGYQIEVYASLGVPDIITEINGALRDQSGVMSPSEAVAVAGSGVTIISQYSGATDLGVSMEGLAQSALADAQNSVQIFTSRFGPSPFDRLAITQQAEWTFGQAWPGLIYLPYAAAFSTQARAMLGLYGMAEFIDEVGIHEIAHQWWGHLIGWKSYRDQWISEGFAEFSASLVLEATGGQEAYDAFWRRRRLNVLGTRFGTAPPSWTGSVTLGYRASSARSPYAYQGLAYGKGGFILHMLRDLMRDTRAQDPDAAFFAMLRDFAQSYAGKEASTGDFQRMVQKHFVPQLNAKGDGKIDWFFDQWVYGRSVPTIESDLKWESAGRKKYRIFGTVSQSNVPDEFISVVSFFADLGKDGIGTFGRTAFRGEMSRDIDVVVELSRKPKELMVNYRNGVLAYDP